VSLGWPGSRSACPGCCVWSLPSPASSIQSSRRRHLGDVKQGPYAGNSFLISCPLRLRFLHLFSFRYPLLPSLPSPPRCPGRPPVIYPPPPTPRAVGSQSPVPKQPPWFHSLGSASPSSSHTRSVSKRKINNSNGFCSAQGQVALSNSARGCPIDLTMRLLLGSAQLCRLVCSTRGRSPRQ
jgi:hypothetical protein